MDNVTINGILSELQNLNSRSIAAVIMFDLGITLALILFLTMAFCLRSYVKGMRRDFKSIKSDLAVTLKPAYANDIILASGALLGLIGMWYLVHCIEDILSEFHIVYALSFIDFTNKKVDAQTSVAASNLYSQFKFIVRTCMIISLVFQSAVATLYSKYLSRYSEVFSFHSCNKFTKTEVHKEYIDKKFLTATLLNLASAPTYTFDPIDSLASSVTRETCEILDGLEQVEGYEKGMIEEELEENKYTSYCYTITSHNNYQENKISIHLYSLKDEPKSSILYVKDIQEVIKSRAKMEVLSEVLKSEYVNRITIFDANRNTICLMLTPEDK